MTMRVNTFDIDGVIFMGEYAGVYPGPNDIIITGRSYEEMDETMTMLNDKGIKNTVYFNPLPFDKKTRVSSGLHKANIINNLKKCGTDIGVHFEDDEIQIAQILANTTGVKVVQLVHSLVEKENVRHI